MCKQCQAAKLREVAEIMKAAACRFEGCNTGMDQCAAADDILDTDLCAMSAVDMELDAAADEALKNCQDLARKRKKEFKELMARGSLILTATTTVKKQKSEPPAK